MFKLAVTIKPDFIPLVKYYNSHKKWEEYPFIQAWYQFLFQNSMYYLNGAQIYFEEFMSSELTDNVFVVTHPNRMFLQGFVDFVITIIGETPPLITSETDEYKKDMCIATMKCFLHDVKFDMLKFATWYLTLDQTHINNMRKDEKLLLATLGYDNIYRTFFN